MARTDEDRTSAGRDRDQDAEPVLRVESVTVERGGRRVLDGVTLSVPADARLLIRGPSGAGKTTLFRWLRRATAGAEAEEPA
jgi:ABC-type molybdenum transport system ATPase subunit/photorepair protein PhrA